MRDFMIRLHKGSVFTRGLPATKYLQELPIARILSKVLCEHSIVESCPLPEEDATVLDRCYREGWLHAEKDGEEASYVFASPLHQLFMEWKLQDTVPSIPIELSSLLQLVLEVIAQFSPRSLSAK